MRRPIGSISGASEANMDLGSPTSIRFQRYATQTGSLSAHPLIRYASFLRNTRISPGSRLTVHTSVPRNGGSRRHRMPTIDDGLLRRLHRRGQPTEGRHLLSFATLRHAVLRRNGGALRTLRGASTQGSTITAGTTAAAGTTRAVGLLAGTTLVIRRRRSHDRHRDEGSEQHSGQGELFEGHVVHQESRGERFSLSSYVCPVRRL